MPPLILASNSSRRRQLLLDAGYTFDVHPAAVDEQNYPDSMPPSEVARRLAAAKAEAVAEQFPSAVVLGADTVVTFGDMILGKPLDADHARYMLDLLGGTTHIVITGVAVVHRAVSFAASTRVMSAVRMRCLTPGELDRYVASGQWQGKAGGYGIQDNDPFVTRMSGSHSNIVGLPMEATAELLASAGVRPVKQPPQHGG